MMAASAVNSAIGGSRVTTGGELLNAGERVFSVGAGMLLLYPERTSMLAGILTFTLVVVMHVARVRSRDPGRA
jgi:hypothetical protein